jgi:ferritin
MLREIKQSAIDNDDVLTDQWLIYLLGEQIKEEQNCYDILAMLKVASDDRSALLFADNKIKDWEN